MPPLICFPLIELIPVWPYIAALLLCVLYVAARVGTLEDEA